KSDWTTALAVLALRILAQRGEAQKQEEISKSVDRGFDFLFGHRWEFFNSFFARTVVTLLKGPNALETASGWAWNPGCYHWVEPTSYSLLALKMPEPPKSENLRKA